MNDIFIIALSFFACSVNNICPALRDASRQLSENFHFVTARDFIFLFRCLLFNCLQDTKDPNLQDGQHPSRTASLVYTTSLLHSLLRLDAFTRIEHEEIPAPLGFSSPSTFHLNCNQTTPILSSVLVSILTPYWPSRGLLLVHTDCCSR